MAGMPEDLNASPGYYLAFLGNIDIVKREAWPVAHTLGVLWSVAIEEQFYFIWPILLVIINRKWLPLLFILIIGGSIVFRAVYDSFFIHEHHTFSCIGDMAFGGLGAYLVQNTKVVSWITNVARWKIAFTYIAFAGIYFFRDELLLSFYFSRIFERSIIAAIILMIILEQNYARNSFFKLSDFKTLSKLGTITYGMYCLHFFAIFVVTNLTLRYHLNSEVWEVVILEPLASLVLTIIISKLSYRFFESWFLSLKERFSFITKESDKKYSATEQ
jgi:peptidoglycan/LPS O-acetylase OafA/YrhL